MCNMTVQELLNELRKYPKYLAVAYDYERHYMFYVSTIINNYNKSIILSCDIGNISLCRHPAKYMGHECGCPPD